MIVITYTTQYRKGGSKFKRVAETLAEEQKKKHDHVLCESIESKRDLKAIFHRLKQESQEIDEFHFIGHSGMYGPMYGTVEYPEQFSPFEWEQLEIPFAKTGKAYFSCCRSARWFAPFFAKTHQVSTFGYHWYTTFSASKARFKMDWKGRGALYSIGCPGKKSHGLLGSLRKYLGIQKAEAFKQFDPPTEATDDSYDKVAELYDAVFQDIRVREDEWEWLNDHWPSGKPKMLDIGCGNGALLNALAERIDYGAGVDASGAILALAKSNNRHLEHLSFEHITGPKLPFPDDHFDLVTSLLSFRYLDWDPLFEEIKRVMKPTGKMIIIDMVTAPVKWREYPQLLQSKIKHYRHRKKYPAYYQALTKLVKHPDWKVMLKYNPIRAQHEMQWYLESRFEGRNVEVINIGWNARVLAFDTGNMQDIQQIRLTYP